MPSTEPTPSEHVTDRWRQHARREFLHEQAAPPFLTMRGYNHLTIRQRWVRELSGLLMAQAVEGRP